MSNQKSKPKGSATRKTQSAEQTHRIEAWGIGWLALGIFCCLCLMFGNATGVVGIFLRNQLYGILGIGAWFAAFALCALGFDLIRRGVKKAWQPKIGRIVLCSLLLLSFFMLYHLIAANASVMKEKAFGECLSYAYARGYNTTPFVGIGCGWLGSLVCWPILRLIGAPGAYVLSVALLLGSAGFLFNLSWGPAARGLDKTARKTAVTVQKGIKDAKAKRTAGQEGQETPSPALPDLDRPDLDDEAYNKHLHHGIDTAAAPTNIPGAIYDPDELIDQRPAHLPHTDAPSPSIMSDEGFASIAQGGAGAYGGGDPSPATGAPNTEPDIWSHMNTKKDSAKVKNAASEDAPPWEQMPLPVEDTGTYRLPGMDLLRKAQPSTQVEDVSARARLLEQTLAEFDIAATVVSISQGPVITRFELQPAAGVRVNRIAALVDDIAMRLATGGIRIEAPVPDKSVVGIEVPNRNVEQVALRSVMESSLFAKTQRLPIALGKDIAGYPVVADLTRMPHLLIAGQTGSGKSVCINAILLSLLYRTTPADLRLILVDPKVVELASYRGLPHLLTPVVTEPRKAAGALAWAVAEMEKRYRNFGEYNVREIERYNEKRLEAGEEKLPYLVVIIDEMADLMLVAPKDVEESVCRIAQLGRAAGIHMIVATQRPSVNVITGVIKANLPSRIAFLTASQVDSRTILDYAGAEKLLGRGDMLFCPSGQPKAVRAQGCFVSDSEVERVVEYVKGQDVPTLLDESIAEHDIGSVRSTDGATETDELLAEALEIVVTAGTASTSMLQRKLRIGFARAGRIIDIMEQNGYIGPADGAKPREVFASHGTVNEIREKDELHV